MENRSGETNNPQNSAENAFDYAAADITNELPRGDMLQDPAGEPFQSTFEEEKPKKLNFFNKIGRMNPQKRAVLLVRIFIVIAFSVLFAVYCVKNRANFEIDSLAVSAVSLAVFYRSAHCGCPADYQSFQRGRRSACAVRHRKGKRKNLPENCSCRIRSSCSTDNIRNDRFLLS